VALDRAGNVYVTDTRMSDNRVVKLSAGSGGQTTLPFTGLNQPTAVAVGNDGSVYVSDYNNRRVLKLSTGSASQTVLPFVGLSWPAGVAVDGAGNLYVADAMNARIVKLAAG
jgi:serine/threonine-protein kinase